MLRVRMLLCLENGAQWEAVFRMNCSVCQRFTWMVVEFMGMSSACCINT